LKGTRDLYLQWGETAKVLYASLEGVPRGEGEWPSIKAREAAARNIKRIVMALDFVARGGHAEKDGTR
jgi:hypothetical protein